MASAVLKILDGWQVSTDPIVPQVGERVWAKFQNGWWYAAQVVQKRADGQYVITWSDGDKADTVKSPKQVSP